MEFCGMFSFFFFVFSSVKFGVLFFFIDQKSELKVNIGNVDFQYFDFEEMLREKLVVEILTFFFFIGEWKDYFVQL